MGRKNRATPGWGAFSPLSLYVSVSRVGLKEGLMDVRLQQLLKDRCSDQPALHPETLASPTVTSDPCMATAQLPKCFSYSELITRLSF